MAGAFRLGKRTIRYTPLCDPSMAPIHSDRERRHSLSSPPPNRYKQAVEEEVLRSDRLAHNAAEWHYIVNYQIIISA